MSGQCIARTVARIPTGTTHVIVPSTASHRVNPQQSARGGSTATAGAARRGGPTSVAGEPLEQDETGMEQTNRGTLEQGKAGRGSATSKI
jgi:hypothetical protein